MKKTWIVLASMLLLGGMGCKTDAEGNETQKVDTIKTDVAPGPIPVDTTKTVQIDTNKAKSEAREVVTKEEEKPPVAIETTKETPKTVTTETKTTQGRVHSSGSHLYDTQKESTDGKSIPPRKKGKKTTKKKVVSGNTGIIKPSVDASTTTTPKTTQGRVHSSASHLYDTQKEPQDGKSIPPLKNPPVDAPSPK